MYSYLNYSILALLLSGVYFFARKALNVEGPALYRLRIYLRQSVGEHGILYRLLSHENTDRLFRSAGLPRTWTSYQYNIVRYSIILGALMIYNVQLYLPVVQIFSKFMIYMVIMVVILLSARRPFLGYQIIRFIRKMHLRDINNEVYSLYIQLKTEYTSNGKTDNTYNILLGLRKYFIKIRPGIDKAISRWNGVDGAEKAWDAFAEEIGTVEAKELATVMKKIETIPKEEAANLISQKHAEFANRNYNAYNNYLKDRANLIFVFVYICTLGIFINIGIVHYLQYKEIISFMNML